MSISSSYLIFIWMLENSIICCISFRECFWVLFFRSRNFLYFIFSPFFSPTWLHTLSLFHFSYVSFWWSRAFVLLILCRFLHSRCTRWMICLTFSFCCGFCAFYIVALLGSAIEVFGFRSTSHSVFFFSFLLFFNRIVWICYNRWSKTLIKEYYLGYLLLCLSFPAVQAHIGSEVETR